MERRAIGHSITGVVGIAITLTAVLGPSASAWASGAKRPSGSHSKSALCTAAKNQTASTTKEGQAVAKAIEAGNWPAAQKQLLAAIGSAAGLEQKALGYLSSAPSNVRAAEQTVLKLVTTEKSIIKNSTSLAQFESSLSAAAQNPKLLSAEKTLASYFGTQCGTTTPTT